MAGSGKPSLVASVLLALSGRNRAPRLPCGCRPGKPRYDCVPCGAMALIREAIESARREMVREMTPLPDWWLRDVMRPR